MKKIIHRSGRGVVVALAATLVLAACSQPDSGSDDGEKKIEASSADMSFVENYVGFKPGKVDADKDPITVAFTSQQGGQQQFPESAAGFEATAAFMNKEFGGIDGHKIDLKECFIQTEEDGQKCATEFINDDKVDIIVKAVTVLGAESFVSTINGRMPIYSPSFVVPQDSSGKDVYTANPATLRLIAQADVIHQQFPDAKNIALVYQDNPSGKGAYQVLVQRLKSLGDYSMKAVPVPDTATATDVTSALQSAGGSKADVVIPVATSALCIAIADGMKSLGITADVVATSNCYADPVLDKFDGSLPEGWYFIDNGVNPYVIDTDSGTHLFRALMQDHKVGKKFTHAGYGLDSFGTVLHIAKLVNQIGPDKLTPDTFRDALKSYKGEVPGRAGTFDCGATKAFPALCLNWIGLSQWKDGEMHAIASAQNGKAIQVKF